MIRLQTLGALRARGPEGEVRAGRKELALLVYLARRAPQPVPRAELATLLWGERRDAQARQSLRQALVRLKRAVNLPLDVQAESVALLPGDWELDVAAFGADLAAGRLREAVARWEGDFLTGTEDVGGEGFRQWVEVEREALRQRVGPAFERLVDEAERAADWRAAVEWAEGWAAARPLDERAHRRLVEVLRLAGRLDQAAATHATFVARLRAELDIEPSPEILRLGAELAQHTPAVRRARPSPGSRALFTPDLVGRATVFGQLSACWAAVRAGAGAAVLVDGDEGIGKTRLCEEFLRSVAHPGHDAPVVLRARGYEAGRDVPWAVARELLAPLKDAPGVPGASPGALVALGRLVPAIRERFPPPLTAAPGEWAPDEAVAEVLAAAAAESPVVIFVDDIPSADSASQQLILSLTRRGLGMRVLLLLAARTEDLEGQAALAELRTGNGLHRLRLQPLRETDVEALLGSMLDLRPEDRRRLSERLLAESGGNPFQIIQVTAALLDDGHLAPDAGGTWRLTSIPEDQPLPVPASVREAVGRRLARLGEPARRLAEAAAVLAEPASREVLQEVSGLSAADLDSALDELIGRRLLRAPPLRDGRYEYAHDLSRRVVYDLLPAPRRQALHGAALTGLRALGTSEPAARAARQYHRARAGSAAWPVPAWARSRRAAVAAGALAASAAIAVVALARRPAEGPTVLAVGAIRDHTGADSLGLTRAVADLLATNVARVPGVQMVSTARLYEVLGQLGTVTDSGSAIARAARQAGATELLEGALYRAPDGALRLDLRRIDLSGGAIRGAYSAWGTHPFALVDSATSELARALDIRTPPLRVVDVTTSSLVAHRFYEEGLRLYQSDARSAQRLFEAALAEDSTFAMAGYHVAMCQLALGDEPAARATLFRAARLAGRATERERLLIRTSLAFLANDPAGLAMAETLVTRYPTEPDGPLLVGQARLHRGDFLGALPYLRRVVDMDSLAFRGGAVRCRACDALGAIVGVYTWADSLAAAERTARQAIQRSHNVPGWKQQLAWILERQGRVDEALAMFRQASGIGDPAMFRASVAIRAGDFTEADRILNDVSSAGAVDLQNEALWLLSISLRYQGRLAEALAAARRLRRAVTERTGSKLPPEAVIEAQALFEMGRVRHAAALFDSLRHLVIVPDFPALAARHRTWLLTHRATALAAGDTATLAGLLDSLEAYGRLSAYGRDPRLHHHARGLLWRARGRPAEAEPEFRRAIFSPSSGYTRTNLELGRTLLELGRPREAIAVVAPALRGPLEASNLYVTHTELHELLARAYDAAGQADSAAAHYRWVLNAWRTADPQFHVRREAIRRRLSASGSSDH